MLGRAADRIARGLDLPRPTPPRWFRPAVVAGAIGFVARVVNPFRTGRSGRPRSPLAGLAGVIHRALRHAEVFRGGSSGGFGGGATGSW